MRLWHLLTHTAGLTYGFHYAHPVDAMYRAAGFEWVAPKAATWPSAATSGPGCRCCSSRAASGTTRSPATCSAGWSRWSAASRWTRFPGGADLRAAGHARHRVLGRGGRRQPGRAVQRRSAGRPVRNDELGGRALRRPACLAGGGGLVSTAADYHRFTQALVRGASWTEPACSAPHPLLPGPQPPARRGRSRSFGRRLFTETTFDGVGFGSGFAVLLDPVANKVLSTPGELAWGGAASTFFWVDPAEQLTAVFLTQLMPSSTYPLRSELRQLVYQALVG